jgi:hypothetical protein
MGGKKKKKRSSRKQGWEARMGSKDGNIGKR